MTGLFFVANICRLEATRYLVSGADPEHASAYIEALADECLRVNPSFIGGGSDGWWGYVESPGGEA